MIKKFVKTAKAPAVKKKVNLDPRSDLSEEDEIIQELVDTVKKMSKDEMDALYELKNTLKKNVQDSIEEIVEETEGEMNMKLDGMERHNAINELHSTFQELMSKLDKVNTYTMLDLNSYFTASQLHQKSKKKLPSTFKST